MSGSSAPHYGTALLQTLHALGSVETHLVLSDGARLKIQLEADLDPELVCRSPTSCTTRTIWPRRFRGAHFCSTARSQVLIYHFMFGPSYADGCPVNSSIADAFDSLIPHLKARDVSFIAVSGAPIEKLVGVSRADGVGLHLGLQLSERFPAAGGRRREAEPSESSGSAGLTWPTLVAHDIGLPAPDRTILDAEIPNPPGPGPSKKKRARPRKGSGAARSANSTSAQDRGASLSFDRLSIESTGEN